MRKLNTVYMRVLRWSDRQVRAILSMQAIETYITQLRLGCLRQVLASPVPQVRALLAVRDKNGHPLPWVQLVVSDMHMLKSCLPLKLSELGDPSTDFCAWTRLITNFPARRKQLVWCLTSPISVLDKPVAAPQCTQQNLQRTFFSQRALNMHLLKVQGRRSPIAQNIGPDNRCPVCHTVFAAWLLHMPHSPNRGVV